MKPCRHTRLIRLSSLRCSAISFSGAILGLAVPLAFCMANSVNVWDIVIWGILALVLQLLTYRLADLLLKDLPRRIASDEVGAAILVAAIKLAVGSLNAAALSG